MSKLKKIILLSFSFYFIFTGYAFSYIDLSVVAIFFQMIFAGIIAALFTIKLWFKNFKNLISKMFKRKSKK